MFDPINTGGTMGTYIPEWEQPDSPTRGMTQAEIIAYYKRTAPHREEDAKQTIERTRCPSCGCLPAECDCTGREAPAEAPAPV